MPMNTQLGMKTESTWGTPVVADTFFEFENESNDSETSTEGTNKNKAPPAALLLLGAHDTEEVAALQLMNVGCVVPTSFYTKLMVSTVLQRYVARRIQRDDRV